MRLLFAATAFGAWHWWIYKPPLLAPHDLDNWFCTLTIEPPIRAMFGAFGLLLAATQLYLDWFLRLKRSFCALKVPIPLALSQQSLYIKTAFPAQDFTWDCSWLLLAVFVCFSALFRRIQVPTMSSAEAKPRHVTQSGQDYLQHVLGLAPLSATHWAFLAKSPQVAPALILAFNRCFVHLYVTFCATTPVRYQPLQVGGNRLWSKSTDSYGHFFGLKV